MYEVFLHISKVFSRNDLQYVIENGKLFVATAIDYFIFSKNLYTNIPDFIIGRTRWDNYLLGSALFRTLNVFDATDTIFAIHQNHSYKHHISGHSGVWKGLEAEHNRRLQNQFIQYSTMGNIKKSFFKLKKKNNHIEISPNWQGYVKCVFSYIKSIGIR